MSTETTKTTDYPDLGLWYGAAAESRHIDWQKARGEDLDGFRYWEAVETEVDGEYRTLICDGNTVVKVLIEGRLYDEEEWEDYADAVCEDVEQWEVLDFNDERIGEPFADEDEANDALVNNDDAYEVRSVRPEGFIEEDAWGELFTADTYAEGPMMNFWYPLDARSSFDSVEAAAAISNFNLCVVQVDDEYGLALTGGGMDLSWDIAGAFVALGYWPPAFIDLPNMAGTRRTEENEKVVMAVIQHAQREINNLEYKIKRHRDLLAGLLPAED